MGYITFKDSAQFKASYQAHGFGTVDPIADLFGKARLQLFGYEMEAWCALIDAATIPFLFDWFQNALIWVVQQVYNQMAEQHYWKGVDEGRTLTGKVAELTAWAKGEIDRVVGDAKTYVQNSLINPINAQIDQQLTPAINAVKQQVSDAQAVLTSVKNGAADAQNKASDALNTASQALQNANKALTDVSTVQEAVNKATYTAAYAVQNANQALKTVNDTTAKVNTVIADLNGKTAQIQDILKRLTAIEGKTSSPQSATLLTSAKNLFT